MGKKKEFFGFKAMVLLALVNFMAYFMVGIYGATMSSIMTRLNCSMTVFSSFSTAYILVSFVVSMFAGKIYDKVGSRNCVLFYVFATVVYILGMECSNSIPLIYVCCMIYGVAVGIGGRAAISKFVSEWFEDRRDEMIGYVCGIYNLGAGVGMIVFGAMLNRVSLTVLLVVGISVPTVISVIGWLMMKSPRQLGQKPYTKGKQDISADAASTETKEALEGVDFDVILKSPSFWLLIISSVLAGLAVCPGTYMQVVMVSVGVSESVAAMLFGIQMLAQCVMSMLVGKLLSTLKYVGYVIVTYALLVGGLVLLEMFYVTNLGNAAAILTAFIIGAGSGAVGLVSAYMPGQFFGMKAYGTIMAVLTAVTLVGSCFVPVTISPIVTADGGSWQKATIVCIVLMLISVASLGLAALTAPMRKIRKAGGKN